MADGKMLWSFIVLLQGLLTFVLGACPEGYFGWRCQLKCENCDGLDCDQDTGKCLSTCKSGYYGHHCLFSNDCMYDSEGIYYTGKKTETSRNTPCLNWSDVNISKVIFEVGDEPNNFCRNPELSKKGRLNKLWCYVSSKGEVGYCNVKHCPCPKHLYGDGCMKQCHCQLPDEICDLNGVCNEGCADGWTGIQCQTPCEKGKFGLMCQYRCKNCLNEDCNHETGQCTQGCIAGYMGDNCQTVCVRSYGNNCNRSCGRCKDNDVCDPESGDCRLGCDPGYMSANFFPRLCEKQCSLRYGPNCESKCGACFGGDQCDFVTGVCPRGCEVGYTSDKCNSSCPSFYYGKDCAKKCGICKNNSSCDPFNGRCLLGCGDGYMGFDCIIKIVAESETASIPIWAGVAAAVVAVIILIAVCIVIKKRRQRNLSVLKNKSLDQGEGTMTRDESIHLLGDSRIGSEPPSFAREDDDNYKNGIHEPIYMNVNNRKQTSPVPVSELYDYIMKNKEQNCQGFMKEFEELPMGLLALCDVARRQENKVKNRYGNIVAYDHSRVILDPLPNEPHSDYVNANFMDQLVAGLQEHSLVFARCPGIHDSSQTRELPAQLEMTL